MKKRSNNNYRAPGFNDPGNPDFADAMRQLARSSGASRHVPKPRKGSRRQRERQAIRDQRREQ